MTLDKGDKSLFGPQRKRSNDQNMSSTRDGFDFVLVMTASVNPNGMSGLSRESVDNREQQYIDTLAFYASEPSIARILFVENSAWPLKHIQTSVPHAEKITWLSLNENSFPREWGKGYGEFLLMDRAVDALEKMPSLKGKTIVKVTGRFPILNISAMVQEFAHRVPLELALDVLDHPLYDWLHLGWNGHHARTILYAVTPTFYRQHIYGRYREIPSQFQGAEDLMFDVWRKVRDLPGIWPRFCHEPRLSGFAGSGRLCIITAYNYDGWMAKCKRILRQCIRRILPFLWI